MFTHTNFYDFVSLVTGKKISSRRKKCRTKFEKNGKSTTATTFTSNDPLNCLDEAHTTVRFRKGTMSSSLSSSNNKFLLNFLFCVCSNFHSRKNGRWWYWRKDIWVAHGFWIYMLWIYYNLCDLTMRNVCRKIKRMNKEKGWFLRVAACVSESWDGARCFRFNMQGKWCRNVCVLVRHIYRNLWQMKKVLELYANFQKSIVVKWQSHEYENGINSVDSTRIALTQHMKMEFIRVYGTWKTICVT